MPSWFCELPDDIIHVVLQFLESRGIGCLDSALCTSQRYSSWLPALRGTYCSTIIAPSHEQWVRSRGVAVDSWSLDLKELADIESLGSNILKLGTLRVLVGKTANSFKRWDSSIWSSVHASTFELDLTNTGRLGISHIMSLWTPSSQPWSRLKKLQISLNLNPDILIDFIDLCKHTLEELSLSSEKDHSHGFHTLTSSPTAEWPMLRTLNVHMDYGLSSTDTANFVTCVCLERATHLSRFTLRAVIPRMISVEVTRTLLVHHLWRPRSHILTIIVVGFADFPVTSDDSKLPDMPPTTWETEDPPVTQWEFELSPIFWEECSTVWNAFLPLLPLHQQHIVSYRKDGWSGMVGCPTWHLYQHRLEKCRINMIAMAQREVGEIPWDMVWSTPMLKVLEIEIFSGEFEDAYEGLQTAARSKEPIRGFTTSSLSMPRLNCLQVVCRSRVNNDPGHLRLCVSLARTVAECFSSSLTSVTLLGVSLTNLVVIEFVSRCRSLKYLNISSLDEFHDLDSAHHTCDVGPVVPTNIIRQHCPASRNFSLAAIVPVSAHMHDLVWTSIRRIAALWQQHSSSYRRPCRVHVVLMLLPTQYGVRQAAEEAWADLPYVWLQ